MLEKQTQSLRTDSLQKSVKKTHSAEKNKSLNRAEQNNIEHELSVKWPQKRKGKKRNTPNAKKPYKSAKKLNKHSY